MTFLLFGFLFQNTVTFILIQKNDFVNKTAFFPDFSELLRAGRGIVGTEKEIIIETTVPSSYTVLFTNSRKWSGTIYCHYWCDADHHMTKWPGNKMTFERTNSSGQDIYSISSGKYQYGTW